MYQELDDEQEEGLQVEIEDGVYVLQVNHLEELCTLLTLKIWNLFNSSKLWKSRCI